MITHYNQKDLDIAFSKVVEKDQHDVILVLGDLTYLGKGGFATKEENLEAIYRAIKKAGGENITIVVHSFTHKLTNTDIPFSKKIKTENGIFSNFIIEKPESVRSHHPFNSLTAIGPNAEFICRNNSKFSYGFDSPYDRILKLKNPITISIGLKPNITSSIIHHVEFMAHVPYRYIKEFVHPMEYENGDIKLETFYMHLRYREVYDEIFEKRDENLKFFKNFEKHHNLLKEKVGRSYIYGYNTLDLYNSSMSLMRRDIYSWLREELSENRPYRR
jgi:aminoglycoside 3-N-acetyltransferase